MEAQNPCGLWILLCQNIKDFRPRGLKIAGGRGWGRGEGGSRHSITPNLFDNIAPTIDWARNGTAFGAAVAGWLFCAHRELGELGISTSHDRKTFNVGRGPKKLPLGRCFSVYAGTARDGIGWLWRQGGRSCLVFVPDSRIDVQRENQTKNQNHTWRSPVA